MIVVGKLKRHTRRILIGKIEDIETTTNREAHNLIVIDVEKMSQATRGSTIDGDGDRTMPPAASSANATPSTTQQETTSNSAAAQKETRYTPRNNFNNLSWISTGDNDTKGENESFGYVIGTRIKKLSQET